MLKNFQIQALFFAFLAAIFNAFVGIFSVFLFKNGFASFEIAFYKCFIASLILLAIVIYMRKLSALLAFIRQKFVVLLVLAFFGFFMLYHFETAAYTSMSVANVVFVLFGVSMIITFICEALNARRFFEFKELLAMFFALLGLWIIFLAEGGTLENFTHLKGLLNAFLAGFGYALFLFFTRKFKLGFGLIPLCALLFIGSLYLIFPLFGASLNSSLSFESFILLLALAFLPTIGGFYCTTRALSLAKANSVQLIELSEPVFAMIFGALFLSQSISFLQILGGVFILFAIFVCEIKTIVSK